MKRLLAVFACAALIAFAASSKAHADYLVYSGFDAGPLSSVPAAGNAATARASFLGSLSGGVGTESFEGFANGSNGPFSLTFPGSTGNITANLTSTSSSGLTIQQGGFGRFATSGTNYLDTSGGVDFTINFSSAISAFGFYGTDIGDFNGNLVLELSNGTTRTETLSTGGSPNASLLFWGFTDTDHSYTSLKFTNTGGSDFFGFDDMTVGDASQITSVIPEPSSLALMGLGLVTFGVGRRRRTS